MEKKMNSQEQENSDDNDETIFKLLPIDLRAIFASLAIFISIWALFNTKTYQSSPANISFYKPTGYAVIRGLYSFPSDHLVIPIEWVNNGGTAGVIRHPTLTLNNLANGEVIEYTLAGEYDNISTDAINDRQGYEMKRSFIINPHSIELKVLVFHVENWWNNDIGTYNSKFDPEDCFKVTISYQVNDDEPMSYELSLINIFGSIDNLHLFCDRAYVSDETCASYFKEHGIEKPGPEVANTWWDFWSLENVTCE
jgi:hypothetical protein